MEVWLIEAENVPKMDFFGSGQPFGKYAFSSAIAPCSFCYNPATQRTSGTVSWKKEGGPGICPLHLAWMTRLFCH